MIETIQLRAKKSRLAKKEVMKKFVYTMFAVLFVTFATNAQEPAELAVSKGTEALAKSKSSGEYTFTLPSNVTKEDVAKSSKYYTHYFTVDFDAKAHNATSVFGLELHTDHSDQDNFDNYDFLVFFY